MPIPNNPASVKSTVKLSTYSWCVTIAVTLVLYVAMFCALHNTSAFFTLLAVYLLLLIFGLIYSPWYVKADSREITVKSILKKRVIPLADVRSVEIFSPTMGARRVVGSGGFMGYWGIFNEGGIGRYAAFYGRSSDCFLVRLADGDKYVIGCENPQTMVDFIKSHIQAQ
ncbi:MAG: hypothetical protein J6C91_01545 [Muribaculaceae bacterium]|nr:hypothetical protein [Muribaculaceae bacterium]